LSCNAGSVGYPAEKGNYTLGMVRNLTRIRRTRSTGHLQRLNHALAANRRHKAVTSNTTIVLSDVIRRARARVPHAFPAASADVTPPQTLAFPGDLDGFQHGLVRRPAPSA